MKTSVNKAVLDKMTSRRRNPIHEDELLAFGLDLANYLSGKSDDTTGIDSRFIAAEGVNKAHIHLDVPTDLNGVAQTIIEEMTRIMGAERIRLQRTHSVGRPTPEEINFAYGTQSDTQEAIQSTLAD